MNRNERDADFEQVLQSATENAASRIWTALPAIVQSVDFNAQTISAQPALQGTIFTQNGEKAIVNMPLLVDVPFMFPKCADFALTMPLKAGDECLVIFASRCIDSWWQNGGINNAPAEYRMHDLSDGFALFAPTSQPKVISSWNAQNVQLRNTAGDVFIEITPAGLVQIKAKNLTAQIDQNIQMNCGGAFSVTAGGAVNITGSTAQVEGSTITLEGQTTINGTLAQNGASATFSGGVAAQGDVTAGGISVSSHTHGGVKSGSDSTGTPQ